MLPVFEYKETLLEREALHGNVTGAAAVIINLDKSLADVLKSKIHAFQMIKTRITLLSPLPPKQC